MISSRESRVTDPGTHGHIDFWKGHAAGNDFLLIADPAGDISLGPQLVARLCDRHRGIGADGLIRAIRTENLAVEEAPADAQDGSEWFMDYRNADGSVAEMCGNGVRVFVHFLVTIGLLNMASGDSVMIGTRAGLKPVRRVGEDYEVDMGHWDFAFPGPKEIGDRDCTVYLGPGQPSGDGLSISMGNPHTVVRLPSLGALKALDLATCPRVEPPPVEGTNLEFVVLSDVVAPDGTGRLTLRVYERGVGETLSCGTGACAAAAAARFWTQQDRINRWLVAVPGGSLSVTFVQTPPTAQTSLERVLLRGPAQIVANGTWVMGPEEDGKRYERR